MQRQMGYQVIYTVNGEVKIDLVKAIKFIDPMTIEVSVEGDQVIRVDGFYNYLQEFSGKFDKDGRGLLTGDIVKYKDNYYSVAFADSSMCIVSEVLQSSIILSEPIAMQCEKVGNVVQNGELIAPPKAKEILEKNEQQIG